MTTLFSENAALLEMLLIGKQKTQELKQIEERLKQDFLQKLPESIRPLFDYNTFELETKDCGSIKCSALLENGLIRLTGLNVMFERKGTLELTHLPVSYFAQFRLSDQGYFGNSISAKDLETVLFMVYNAFQKAKQKTEPNLEAAV